MKIYTSNNSLAIILFISAIYSTNILACALPGEYYVPIEADSVYSLHKQQTIKQYLARHYPGTIRQVSPLVTLNAGHDVGRRIRMTETWHRVPISLTIDPKLRKSYRKLEITVLAKTVFKVYSKKTSQVVQTLYNYKPVINLKPNNEVNFIKLFANIGRTVYFDLYIVLKLHSSKGTETVWQPAGKFWVYGCNTYYHYFKNKS